MNRLSPEPPRAAPRPAAVSKCFTVDFDASRRQQLRCGQQRGRRGIRIKSVSRHQNRRRVECVLGRRNEQQFRA